MSELTIHATNITGLGACQVVLSFLNAMQEMELPYTKIRCYLPSSGPVSGFKASSEQYEVVRFTRKGPKALSRVMECLFPQRFFNLGDHLIVLGDVPLRTTVTQIVLVHQPHLQSPSVNPYVGRGMLFRAMRLLTAKNTRFANCVIAQTEAMADGLRRSYPEWAQPSRVCVIGQPAPSWFTLSQTEGIGARPEGRLKLFYPAAGYPHKNHKVFETLDSCHLTKDLPEITVTLDVERFAHSQAWMRCVGRLDHDGCLREYARADALVFPSVLESYGLPLVEAMTMGIPIIVSDLPYARVLCGDEGIYFNPDSAESLFEACLELKERLAAGWSPDWSSKLEELPKDWSEVVRQFLEIFNKSN